MWYLTYSGQEDAVWYAVSDSRFGPYSNAARLDGRLFYAAKHVEHGGNTYLVGWAKRSDSADSTQEVSGWGGNLVAQQVVRHQDGTLSLAPVDSVMSAFDTPVETVPEVTVTAGGQRVAREVFTCGESFLLRGDFTFTGDGAFGLAFDFDGSPEQYKLISLDPSAGKLSLSFRAGTVPIAETAADLRPGKQHSFTYVQDGSVGVFYLDQQAALTVRLYGATGKPIRLFAENNSVSFTALQEFTI